MKPSDAFKAISFLIDQRRPVMLWGAPGIGKSDLVRSIAASRKIDLIDKRLSQSDPTELKGYPWPDAKTKTMAFFRDGELPTKGKGILFLDELNNAPAATQAPAYQLILDRRLGSYELPEGWAIVAAGNRASDRSIVHTMSTALANRFVHIDIEPDLEDYIKWCKANDITSTTQAYLRYRPGNLWTDKFTAGMRAFPSPRSWAFADKIAHDPIIRHQRSLMVDLLSGTIGEGTATEYVGFMDEEEHVPKLDAILLNPEKAPLPKADQPSIMYAAVSRMENAATPANLDVLYRYAARLPKEFEVMFAHSVSKDEQLMDAPETTNWIQKNHAYLA